MSVLEPPTEEQLTYIYNQLNMTPESLERDVKYLMDWISQQPHLPDGIDERWIRSSLIARKNSVEKVKHSIDLCYTVKGLAPEFFEKRDPLDPELHEIFTKQFAYPLPKLTPEGSRVLLYNIMDLEVKDYEFSKSTKVVLMMGAVQLLEDICRNWVLVFDLRGFTFNHLSTITIPQLKKFLMIAQEAFPIRMKAVHAIFAPPFIDKILSLFKPFLKKKLADRIHVHTDGFGTLFDSVPREIFPKDYGGEEPPFRDLLEKWNKKIIEYRDWFSKDDNRKVDESKRPGKPKSYDEMFGFEGSFRKLSVD
ncbi:alpha-tocopherol transfer protein-like isoform X1 [Anabrus simplex]|uniref:alpha-tocopherol transfer protein-like isoform X1 n=1 Tax=Anabrus simplex TaxID=316456 RepID=UPI0035A2EDFA